MYELANRKCASAPDVFSPVCVCLCVRVCVRVRVRVYVCVGKFFFNLRVCACRSPVTHIRVSQQQMRLRP